MAIAIALKTESSDNYVFVMEGQPVEQEIIEFLQNKMGEEYEYICSVRYDANYDVKFKIKNQFLGN